MSDTDMEKTSETAPEGITEETGGPAADKLPEETPTELVEEKLESEGELTAALADKEYAGLTAEGDAAKKRNEENKEEGETGEEKNTEEEEVVPRARGLYRYIKISLPTLNKLIIVLCAALVICLLYGVQNRGYIVDFDSQGGTPVESEKLMYSDKVAPPEEPYREGYTFTGWYTNADCTEKWDLDTGLVGGPMTLYAGWEKKDQ